MMGIPVEKLAHFPFYPCKHALVIKSLHVLTISKQLGDVQFFEQDVPNELFKNASSASG